MNTPDLYEIFLKYPKVCIDSRAVSENSIFFAIKGDNFDGNLFAKKALEVCAYAVVDNPEVVEGDNYILVDNALEKLQHLAKYHRKRLGIPIIAITGTNGKTTTKELIARVLGKKYNVAYTQGNFNNHIGVPLTLLSFNSSHEFGVVEMGANHIGEIADLCKIAAPDFGIITNVGKAHLEGFGSFEGVKKAKGELYRYLYENDGVAFVNYDNEQLEDMNPPHSVIYYGTKGFTHCQGHIEENGLFLTLRWVVTDDIINDNDNIDWITEGKLVKSQLYGAYNFENVLAAICIGNNFNVSDKDIRLAIESYKPNNNRSQVTKTQNNTIIIDSYNANPTSMKAAIDNFNAIKLDNKVLILADMFELGSAEIREHGALIASVAEMNFSQVFFIGELFYNYNGQEGMLFFESTSDFVNHLKENPLNNMNILVKGSRGMKLETIVEFL